MKSAKPNGYAIIMALVAVAVVGAGMVVLFDISDTLMFDSNHAYLQACNRNLTASGLAWAQQAHNRPRASDRNRRIGLDVSVFNIPNADLQVTWLQAKGKSPRIQIDSKCAQGKMIITTSNAYLVSMER